MHLISILVVIQWNETKLEKTKLPEDMYVYINYTIYILYFNCIILYIFETPR